METTITGAEAAERAAEYLELRGEVNAIRGGAYATLALALATAGRWDPPEDESLEAHPLCGHVSPAGAICSRPAGHETDTADDGHDVHTGHLADTFRVWRDQDQGEWAPSSPPPDSKWTACEARVGALGCSLIADHSSTWHRAGEFAWPAQDNPVCGLEDGHGGPCLPHEGCVRADLSGEIPEQHTRRDT